LWGLLSPFVKVSERFLDAACPIKGPLMLSNFNAEEAKIQDGLIQLAPAWGLTSWLTNADFSQELNDEI